MSRAASRPVSRAASGGDDGTHADVLIVGRRRVRWCGARAGSPEAGIGVVCLEQGDWPDRAGFRGTEPDWELHRPQAVVVVAGHPPRAERLPDRRHCTPTSASSTSTASAAARCLYGAQWPRMLPDDFRVRASTVWPTTGRSATTTCSRTTRRPTAQLGVSGLGGNPAYPPGEDPPLPPLPIGAAGLLVARAHARLGWHWWPGPNAITSAPYEGRHPCVQRGDLHVGLQRGREGVDRPDPLAAGARARRPARHGRTRTAPGRPNARSGRRRGMGSTATVASTRAGRAVVLSRPTASAPPDCSWRRRPRSQPDGLANSSGLVGRRLMLHPLST